MEDNAWANPDPANVINQRLAVLGQVIEWSASMEQVLREAFCSLIGSKFAAVVAGGQSTLWLIEQCKALTDAHREMPDEHKQAIKTALRRCADANERRNHLVHGVKTASRLPDGALQTIKSRNRTHKPITQSWTLAEIQQAAGELLEAGLQLLYAMQQAVSPEVMVIGEALAWEDHYAQQNAQPSQ